MIFAIANAGVCLFIWYSVMCRGAKSDGTADPQIKRAFVLLSFAAFMAGAAPFIWPHRIVSCELILSISIGYLQYVTSRFWHHGTPEPFRK